MKETHMMKRRRECFQTSYLKCHQSKTASLERCSLSLALGNERKVEKQLHETLIRKEQVIEEYKVHIKRMRRE